MKECFWEILKAGLWNEQNEFQGHTLDEEEWKELWQAAQEQAVAGIFLEGIHVLGITLPKTSKMKAMSIWAHIQNMNRLIGQKAEEWCRLLEEPGIELEVFKGPSVGKWYANPLARSYGDIDLVITRGWARIPDLLQRKGIPYTREHQDLIVREDKLIIELHPFREYLYTPYLNKRLQRMWHEEDGPELYLTCLLLHMRRHVLTYGIGLKQFCDVAVMLKNCPMDMEKARRILLTLHAGKFAQAVFGLLEEWLGVKCFPLPPSHNQNEKLLADTVWRDGFLQKREREQQGKQVSSYRRILDNGIFWIKRSIRLGSLMPEEACWFPVYMTARRIQHLTTASEKMKN